MTSSASGTTRDVLARFQPTHVAELVEIRPRSVEDYPELASLDEPDAAAIVSEWRPAEPSLGAAYAVGVRGSAVSDGRRRSSQRPIATSASPNRA